MKNSKLQTHFVDHFFGHRSRFFRASPLFERLDLEGEFFELILLGCQLQVSVLFDVTKYALVF